MTRSCAITRRLLGDRLDSQPRAFVPSRAAWARQPPAGVSGIRRLGDVRRSRRPHKLAWLRVHPFLRQQAPLLDGTGQHGRAFGNLGCHSCHACLQRIASTTHTIVSGAAGAPYSKAARSSCRAAGCLRSLHCLGLLGGWSMDPFPERIPLTAGTPDDAVRGRRNQVRRNA
jgi:hypothetical protein